MSKKIIVIGSGPGGYPAAFELAKLGAEVTVVEKEQIGGVCLNWGCIPSKSYLDSAHRFKTAESLTEFVSNGGKTAVENLRKNLSWEKIQNRRNQTVAKLQNGLASTFRAKKINLMRGEASFKSSNEIEVKTPEKTYVENFDFCIIACGTESFFPPPFDKFKDKLLDNKTVFSLKKLPRSVIIIGGGVIGLEFACFFSALGVSVDIAEIMPNILPGEDENIVKTLKNSLEKRGVKFHLNTKVKEIKIEGAVKTVQTHDGTVMRAEEILVAAGRVLNTAKLGLEKVNVSWDAKGIKTDENFKAADNIYAVGDANGKMLLAHAASAQGVYAACHIMGKECHYNNDLVPKCIYTSPEAASVGLNKLQAEKRGVSVKTQRAFFVSNGMAQATGETEGFVQIVSNAASAKILGAQIAGHAATEFIHVFSVAIAAKMTVQDLKKVIFAHPTMSETIAQALDR
jgi:dihydrolipoamide dehydrogenase